MFDYRVLVTGGRNFENYVLVRNTLTTIYLHRPRDSFVLIHGCATGADTLASLWCIQFNKFMEEEVVQELRFPAKWKNKNGVLDRSAGSKRNKKMLEEGKPDLVVAFPGGNGTAHMKRIAREAGIKVLEIE